MSAGAEAGGRPPRRSIDGLVVVLATIAAVAAAYTVMAFGMEWQTQAGRIGPGFFPRIIGVLLLVLCAVCIARRLRAARPAGDAPREDGVPGARNARLVAGTALATLLYLLVLEPLGALIASALLMMTLLTVINRGRTVTNAALSVLVPAALYLLLQIGLNAGLPPGPLPLV